MTKQFSSSSHPDEIPFQRGQTRSELSSSSPGYSVIGEDVTQRRSDSEEQTSHRILRSNEIKLLKQAMQEEVGVNSQKEEPELSSRGAQPLARSSSSETFMRLSGLQEKLAEILGVQCVFDPRGVSQQTKISGIASNTPTRSPRPPKDGSSSTSGRNVSAQTETKPSFRPLEPWPSQGIKEEVKVQPNIEEGWNRPQTQNEFYQNICELCQCALPLSQEGTLTLAGNSYHRRCVLNVFTCKELYTELQHRCLQREERRKNTSMCQRAVKKIKKMFQVKHRPTKAQKFSRRK